MYMCGYICVCVYLWNMRLTYKNIYIYAIIYIYIYICVYIYMLYMIFYVSVKFHKAKPSSRCTKDNVKGIPAYH